LRLREALSPKKAVRSEGVISQKGEAILGEIPDCPSDNGAIQYWNLNKFAYKVDKIDKRW
jgi:hypothetical protein